MYDVPSSMPWNEFRSNIRHFSARDQKRVHNAFELGQRVHLGQARKSGDPYFMHPMAVAHLLSDMGADADTVIAALLHDSVEDTPLTLPEIEKEFGPAVRSLIEGVTKLSRADMDEQPNVNEQIETLRKIFTLMESDVRIMVIKIVDRLHNMQTVEFLPVERQHALALETMEVYVKIADRLCMQDMRDELEALCLAILEPDVLARLSELRMQNEQDGAGVLVTMQNRLQAHFPQHKDDVHMRYEHKSWDNLREQLQAEGTTVTGISGISISFVCDSVDVCYRVMGTLHQMWQRELMSFQDFINAHAINGYRGLHTTVILEDGTRVRCKIRTQMMQEYARKGVASICFREDMRELHSSLPWTQRISPLATDTAGRSKDFWGTLQSDILGESISIHGPGDRTVQVPKGSTALDGALHFFGEAALRLSSISIGGKQARLDTPLEHAVSVNITLEPHQTVERSWLEYAHTGYATAMVRDALMHGKTEREKIPLGKNLLQRIMTEQKRGFIEEFDRQKLGEKARQMGYMSLDEALVAVADGKVDPKQVYEALFEEPKSRKKDTQTQKCIVNFTIEKNSHDTLGRLLSVYEKFEVQTRTIRLSSGPTLRETHVRFSLELSVIDQQQFIADLRTAGAKNVEIIVRSKREIALMIAVILPWSLNPVWAKWLLAQGFGLFPLISVRLITFALFSAAFFTVWRLFTQSAFVPIKHVMRLAALPAIGNATLSLFTYLSLLFIPPSLHLTILRFSALLMPFLSGGAKHRSRALLGIIGVVLLGCVAVTFYLFGLTLSLGIALSVLTLFFYASYTITTEKNLQQMKIGIRYPYLLFNMGLLLGLIGIVTAFFMPIGSILNVLTANAFLYALICVCIPHVAYAALLNTRQSKRTNDLFFIEAPVAVAVEIWLLGLVLPVWVYLLMALALISVFLLRWHTPKRSG